MELYKFKLKLRNTCQLTPYIVGSCKELGEWVTSKAVPLKKEKEINTEKVELWSLDTSLKLSDGEYKYFLAVPNIDHVEVDIVETFNRNLAEKMSIDEFGVSENTVQIAKSRLKEKFEYKLKIFDEPHFHKESQEVKECLMKCDVLQKDDKTILPHRLTTFSVLNGLSKSPTLVPDSGILMKFDEMSLLSVRTGLSKITLKFSFHLLNEDKVAETSEFAYAYIRLGTTEAGELDMIMTAPDGSLIAIWPMKYLIVKPMSDHSMDLEQRKNDHTIHKPLYIGHRGHGTTFSSDGQRLSNYLENTMGSFQAAYEKGIKAIEFDVMLSKDNVPVVYHDFKTHLRVKNGYSEFKIEIPIQHLSYSDLINNQFQISRDSKNNYDESFYNEEKSKLFTKLEHLFQHLPEDLCFDVEVKYSMALEAGGMEDDNHCVMSRNEYVNEILKVCFNFVGNRYIFFSSFDPDVCSMLKAKQDHFPVMFISQGKSHYENFEDPRAKTLESSIHFAAAEQLFGVVLYTDPLLKQKELVKLAHQLGLKVYVWGEQNNEKEMIQQLASMLVDGIALDNVDMVV